MPIQFLAMRDPVSTEALFSDGSSGEYDASARKRRSAETHSKNPSSSFSRRLFVGLNSRAMNFIGRMRPAREKASSARVTPERDDYRRNRAVEQLRNLGTVTTSQGVHLQCC